MGDHTVTEGNPRGTSEPVGARSPRPTGEARLRQVLRKLRPQPAPPPEPMKPDPTNAFEIAVAERLRALAADVDEIRSRVNWLLLFIVGAAITNVVIAIFK